jgi:small subunit ribosomal protein S16
MAVVIRLMRAGAKKRPFFRMVAADSRRQRDGRFLEILGHYNPVAQPFELVVHKDKVEAWISKGAQPSEQVASLLRKLGIVTQARAAGVVAPAAAESKTAEAPEPRRPAKAAAAKPAKRAVKRAVSARKTKARAARKAGKKKPAPKPAKK